MSTSPQSCHWISTDVHARSSKDRHQHECPKDCQEDEHDRRCHVTLVSLSTSFSSLSHSTALAVIRSIVMAKPECTIIVEILEENTGKGEGG
jgi:hypothetical protein